MKQQLNFCDQLIPGTPIRALFAYMWLFLDFLFRRPPPVDRTLVNDDKSMYRFFNSPHSDEPAAFQLFRMANTQGTARKFFAVLEAWWAARSLAGFFYLINFSPLVAPGFTKDITDVLSITKRYAGAIDKPGPPPPPPLWRVANLQLSRCVFVNNYGVHSHGFSAKPVSFMWDWLELCGPLHGGGCITVNGVFMCWMRGMPSALKQADTSALGEPVNQVIQNVEWFKEMGLPPSLAPKN